MVTIGLYLLRKTVPMYNFIFLKVPFFQNLLNRYLPQWVWLQHYPKLENYTSFAIPIWVLINSLWIFCLIMTYKIERNTFNIKSAICYCSDRSYKMLVKLKNSRKAKNKIMTYMIKKIQLTNIYLFKHYHLFSFTSKMKNINCPLLFIVHWSSLSFRVFWADSKTENSWHCYLKNNNTYKPLADHQDACWHYIPLCNDRNSD